MKCSDLPADGVLARSLLCFSRVPMVKIIGSVSGAAKQKGEACMRKQRVGKVLASFIIALAVLAPLDVMAEEVVDSTTLAE